ncbi:MAG TPA: single-stranded-DNA-specific exonuclease RecJ, partial [Aquifex aeolicus]|nr:single-stranded-DNA-specific exonuclease RecJ [Aquifex aeolicus]
MRGVSGKEWVLLSERLRPSPQLVNRYGYLLAQLLINRGVDREHESFFDLRLKNLLPYHLLPNIEEGIERIIGAVKKGERIILFGDYDVDGVTGTAVLEEVLKEAGAKVISVLPTRSSGYGLNKKLVSAFSKYGELL